MAKKLREAALARVQQRNDERDKQKREKKRERDQYALKEQMKVTFHNFMFRTFIFVNQCSHLCQRSVQSCFEGRVRKGQQRITSSEGTSVQMAGCVLVGPKIIYVVQS